MLGILSGCRSSRDLEAFASRHREALNEALGLDFKRWPSDATFLYLFNKALLQEFGEVLLAWMLSQIPGGTDGLEQLVCDGKSLRGSAIQTDEGSYRVVAKVAVYARALGVALAQKAYDTHGNDGPKKLRSTLRTTGRGAPGSWRSSRHGRAQWQPGRAAAPVSHERPHDAKSPATPVSSTLEY